MSLNTMSPKASSLFSIKSVLLQMMVVLLGLSLSGCVGAVAGVGAAAVAAGNTEKGLGTSISDGVIRLNWRSSPIRCVFVY